ncbi:MAG: hypothetical protein KF906_08930 [Actinobacteria bacterium]|nr:hypothetical protein [Actinomycetota bacterium]
MDRELQEILAEGYLDGLDALSVPELRAKRATCREVETKLSYLRRLIQGHHDIVGGELTRRRDGGSPDDIASLVDRLPSILADRVRGPGQGRLTATVEPGELTGELVDRFTAVTRRVSLDDASEVGDVELERVATDLGALEVEVSATRRAMFDRIDAVEAELTRRYRDGEANVDDLLIGDDRPEG